MGKQKPVDKSEKEAAARELETKKKLADRERSAPKPGFEKVRTKG